MSINDYGVVVDYLQVIEELYNAGVDRGIILHIANARGLYDVTLEATTHIKGVDYMIQVSLITALLMEEDRYKYMKSIAYNVATSMGEVIFIRSG